MLFFCLPEKKPGWDRPYFAPFDDCGGRECITVDSDELCRSSNSDFNFYAICRSLLSSYAPAGGLLHDTPPEVNEQYNLENLLRECAKPKNPDERLRVKDELKEIFSAIKVL